MFSYSERNKSLTEKCTKVNVKPSGSTTGVIKKMTDCSNTETEYEAEYEAESKAESEITISKISYSKNTSYEQDYPTLDAGEFTDVVRQKTKFQNLKDDATILYNDKNNDALKYQETKIDDTGEMNYAESYSQLYDLAKGSTLCGRDTTECFLNTFVNVDPKDSWASEYTELNFTGYTNVSDISSDGTRVLNKLNEPSVENTMLKKISQSTKPTGLIGMPNYNISYSAGLKTDPNNTIFSSKYEEKKLINGKTCYQYKKNKLSHGKTPIFIKNTKQELKIFRLM